MTTQFSHKKPIDMEFVHRIQKGLPTETVESIIKHRVISKQELFTLIPHRTWSRRVKEHRLNPEESERIAMIERLIDFADTVFGDKRKAYGWLRTPNHLLENQRPFDLMSTEAGRRLVETILGRIQHGIYS